MDELITITKKDGTEEEVSLICYFNYNDNNYLVYTKHELFNNGLEKTYVAKESKGVLSGEISDDEWIELKKILKDIISEGSQKNRVYLYNYNLTSENSDSCDIADKDSSSKTDLEWLVYTHENIILMGLGGIGKTTMLIHLYKRLLSQTNYIPLYIPLYSYDGSSNFIKKSIIEQYIGHIDCSLEDAYLNLHRLFQNNTKYKFVIMLDGINETSALNGHIFHEINELSKYKNNGVQLIISSRYDIERIKGFSRFNINRLSQNVVSKHIKNYSDLNLQLKELLTIPFYLTKYNTAMEANKIEITSAAQLLKAYLQALLNKLIAYETGVYDDDYYYCCTEFVLGFLPIFCFSYGEMQKLDFKENDFENKYNEWINSLPRSRRAKVEPYADKYLDILEKLGIISIKSDSIMLPEIYRDFFIARYIFLFIKDRQIYKILNRYPISKNAAKMFGEFCGENLNRLIYDAEKGFFYRIEYAVLTKLLENVRNNVQMSKQGVIICNIFKSITANRNNITAGVDLSGLNLNLCDFTDKITDFHGLSTNLSNSSYTSLNSKRLNIKAEDIVGVDVKDSIALISTHKNIVIVNLKTGEITENSFSAFIISDYSEIIYAKISYSGKDVLIAAYWNNHIVYTFIKDAFSNSTPEYIGLFITDGFKTKSFTDDFSLLRNPSAFDVVHNGNVISQFGVLGYYFTLKSCKNKSEEPAKICRVNKNAMLDYFRDWTYHTAPGYYTVANAYTMVDLRKFGITIVDTSYSACVAAGSANYDIDMIYTTDVNGRYYAYPYFPSSDGWSCIRINRDCISIMKNHKVENIIYLGETSTYMPFTDFNNNLKLTYEDPELFIDDTNKSKCIFYTKNFEKYISDLIRIDSITLSMLSVISDFEILAEIQTKENTMYCVINFSDNILDILADVSKDIDNTHTEGYIEIFNFGDESYKRKFCKNNNGQKIYCICQNGEKDIFEINIKSKTVKKFFSSEAEIYSIKMGNNNMICKRYDGSIFDIPIETV